MPRLDYGKRITKLGRKMAGGLLWFADSVPVAAPAALAAFSAVAVVFLLAGQLRNLYVWPLGLVAAAVATAVVARRRRVDYPGTATERHICNVLVLVGVLIWIGFNTLYAAQHVFTNRDPGTYAVASDWLANHDNLKISAPETFGSVKGVGPQSAGFGFLSPHTDPHLEAQGLHLLPVLLGLMGRIVGDVNMLHTQVIFGGTALLALYAFARLVVKPRWAVVVTATIAVSLPMIYFSRDTYTEPLAMTFTFGALALLWEAQKRRTYSLWFLAGLVAGAGALTRIDAYLTVALLAAFAVIYLTISQQKEHKLRLYQVWWLVMGMAVTSVIGWLDLSRLSQQYYWSTWPQVKPEFLLIVAILLLGLVVVSVAWKKEKWLRNLDDLTKKWRAKALAGLVVLAGIYLASRPLWHIGHRVGKVVNADGSVGSAVVRTYTEQTVNWVIWYAGPIIAVFSLAGLALVAYRLMKKRDALMIPSFLVILGTALFYLNYPHIYADQPWGSRRLLPVILPGLALMGAIGLERLYRIGFIKKLGVEGRTLAIIAATLAIPIPLFISTPYLFVSESAWLSPVKEVCKALPTNAAVLWVGVARTQLVEPVESYCHVPSEGYGKLFKYDEAPSQATLAAAAKHARAAGYEPIVGTFGGDAGLLGGTAHLSVANSYTYNLLNPTYTRPPQTIATFHSSILLGELTNDGTVKPLDVSQTSR